MEQNQKLSWTDDTHVTEKKRMITNIIRKLLAEWTGFMINGTTHFTKFLSPTTKSHKISQVNSSYLDH